jgi:molybdopterin-guanine dinucleotide biosynthesis protein A
MEMVPFAAIVLAGGGGARLGGADKAQIDTGQGTLLDRALLATAGADAVAVVGPAHDLPAGVVQTQEHPPGGGPVAAIAAGLRALRTGGQESTVVVLACDMPFVGPGDVERLVRELRARPETTAVMYADADGRRQYLAAAYRTTALIAAIESGGDPADASMRSVVARLTVAEIAAHPDLTLDCDTWPDVERTRRLLEDR